MKLPDWLRIVILLFLVGILTAYLIYRFNSFVGGPASTIDIIVFLLWLALLLVLVFPEVSLFGVGLKREMESLRSDFKEQVINLRSEIQTQLNVNVYAGDVKEGSAATTGAQTVPEAPPTDETEEQLSLGTLKVLSTLWKHQKKYHGSEITRERWSFVVGFGNINYPEYAIGIGDTMNRGLVTISMNNGQAILTDEGIRYCKAHEDDLLPDWNYERWKGPIGPSWNSSNFITTHRTQRGIYNLHYDRVSKVAVAIGPLEEGQLLPDGGVTLGEVQSRDEAKNQLMTQLNERDGPIT